MQLSVFPNQITDKGCGMQHQKIPRMFSKSKTLTPKIYICCLEAMLSRGSNSKINPEVDKKCGFI